MFPSVRNLRLAASTVADHLTEAPFVLALQVLRRLPSSIVRPLARSVAAVAPKSAHPLFMLASHAAGDESGLLARFEKLLTNPVASVRSIRAADVALAAGQPDWADKFLQRVPDNKKALGTIARRKWFSGDMSGAVEILDGHAGHIRRQRERLRSELEIFRGWRPELKGGTAEPEHTRILHLLTNSVPHTGSGYAQRSHSILTAQKAAGWDPVAVTRLGYPVQIGVLKAASEDVVDGIHYRRLLPSNMARSMSGRLQQQAEALLRISHQIRPSVIHTTTHFVNGLAAREIAHALGVPWVYEVRGQLADTWASSRGEDARQSERYRLFREREAEVMCSADLVVTLGESMKQTILAAGVPEERILISPNAVGGGYLEEPLQHQEARQALGLDEKNLYIGTVSSLVDYEGLDDLVTSFALLAPRLPELRLVVVGDGTAAPSLRNQVKLLGVSDKVIFTGRVPAEKARLYHQALDVFVVPRKDLTVTRSVTPLKPVEALASARPVVASRLDALSEIVHDGINGRLFTAGDPGDLADVLQELLEDVGMRQRLGAAGRRRVLATRTWEANALALGRAYETLIFNNVRKAS